MSGPPDSATVGESELVAADQHSGVIRASPGSTPPPQRERRGTHDRGTHHPDGADARAGAVGALGGLNRVGWTRERRGGLRDLGARVLLRGAARARALRGPGADTGGGAGAWPEGPAVGAPTAGPAATGTEPVRASPAGRWPRRRRLGALPNRTGRRRDEARDEVDRTTSSPPAVGVVDDPLARLLEDQRPVVRARRRAGSPREAGRPLGLRPHAHPKAAGRLHRGHSRLASAERSSPAELAAVVFLPRPLLKCVREELREAA